MLKYVLFMLAAAAAIALPGCASRQAHAAAPAAAATIPPGREGALIRYGRDIVTDTPRFAGTYIRARMSCQACHVNAGRTPHGGSFLGLYARYPQYNKRAKRFIMLQDRIAECFLYSMNGRPPAYSSKTMIALTAYIAFLSRGTPVGTALPGQGLLKIRAPHAPDAASGARLYAAKCAMCHQASGAGVGTQFPPLWGPKSFNDRAGMSSMSKFAAFVKYNMPQNAPGTLTDREAYDIAAYVLAPSHSRPHFNGSERVAFPTEPAAYF